VKPNPYAKIENMVDELKKLQAGNTAADPRLEKIIDDAESYLDNS